MSRRRKQNKPRLSKPKNTPGYEIPFMEVPEGYNMPNIPGKPDTIIVDGCDYETAIVDIPMFGAVPMLTFNFHNSAGVKVAPISLIMDADYLRAFRDGLVQAVDSAIAKAQKHGLD